MQMKGKLCSTYKDHSNIGRHVVLVNTSSVNGSDVIGIVNRLRHHVRCILRIRFVATNNGLLLTRTKNQNTQQRSRGMHARPNKKIKSYCTRSQDNLPQETKRKREGKQIIFKKKKKIIKKKI